MGLGCTNHLASLAAMGQQGMWKRERGLNSEREGCHGPQRLGMWPQIGLDWALSGLKAPPSLNLDNSSTTEPLAMLCTSIDAFLNKDSGDVLGCARRGRFRLLQPFLCTPIPPTWAQIGRSHKVWGLAPYFSHKLGCVFHTKTCPWMQGWAA